MGLRRIVAFSRPDPSNPLGFAQLTGFNPDHVRMVDTPRSAGGTRRVGGRQLGFRSL
jgi:hypothetical protein